MTQPAGTFATNDMIGIREDLSDVIYNIAPVETPFVNMIPHVKATQMNHEWQTDSLAAAANNAVIEGDDVTVAASTPTVRLGNITQLSHKSARVIEPCACGEHGRTCRRTHLSDGDEEGARARTGRGDGSSRQQAEGHRLRRSGTGAGWDWGVDRHE